MLKTQKNDVEVQGMTNSHVNEFNLIYLNGWVINIYAFKNE